MKNVDDVYAFGEFLHLKSKKGMLNEINICNHLESHDFKEFEVKKTCATIEDCFMDLMHS